MVGGEGRKGGQVSPGGGRISGLLRKTLVRILKFRSEATARAAAKSWTAEDGRPLGCWGGVPGPEGRECRASIQGEASQR